MTVTADPDPATGPKAVHFRVDGGLEKVIATTGNPGVASIGVPEGGHLLEFWGEDRLGQQEGAHHLLNAGCPTLRSVAPSAPAGAPPAAKAVISGAKESARRWREGNALAHITAIRRTNKNLPLGTTFSFSLNESANVTFTFTQPVNGRKLGERCVPPNMQNKKKPRCIRTLTRGRLSFTAHAGTNSVAFQGRISRSTRLKPGRYTLVITATNSAGAGSTSASLSFAIVR